MNKLLWVDLETTGTSVTNDLILEVGMIVTDSNLNELDTFQAFIYRGQDELNRMNDWCRKTHAESGLLKAVKSSGNTQSDVEDQMMSFIKKNFGEEKALIAGNSVHFDKKFIERHMPRIDKLLHYRIVDVSSLKETMRVIFHHKEDLPKANHRALDDLRGSIEEYRRYISMIVLPNTTKEFAL